jgi:hypothetical protein
LKNLKKIKGFEKITVSANNTELFYLFDAKNGAFLGKEKYVLRG